MRRRTRWRKGVLSLPQLLLRFGYAAYVLRVLEEQVLQHHSIVMRLVVRGEHQRDPTTLRKRT